MILPDRNWTLFLDRDGVINRKPENDYVKSYEEFEFIPHVKEALHFLRQIFRHTFIVTNQQGVGKRLMTESDLMKIHWEMLFDLQDTEIVVDHIYFCADLAAANSPNRKPQIGMALQAQKDYPHTDLKRSVMIGDSLSDMEFGRNAGMYTILLAESDTVKQSHPALVDQHFKNWHQVMAFFRKAAPWATEE